MRFWKILLEFCNNIKFGTQHFTINEIVSNLICASRCFMSSFHYVVSKYLIECQLLFMAQLSLCEMCPNTEFFLVRIFPHSVWILRDTSYFSVFSPNAEKYGPEKTSYLDSFHAVCATRFQLLFNLWIRNGEKCTR